MEDERMKSNMSGPLEGIRIIDLSQVLFGPFATMVLGELGAEIIKVERPQRGDITRENGPFVRGVSTYFLSLNRGKKSITLDLASKQGRDILLKLTEGADAIIENFKPGTMEKLGLSYETVKEHNPKIIYVAGSGFGQYGPYAKKPAFDIIVQAMGGVMSITGEPGGPPVKPGVSYGDIAAGLFLCIATLSALRERDISGEGQMVDISMLDCQITVQENAFVRYLNAGELPRPLGTKHSVIAPFQVFPTKDSYIAIAPRFGSRDQWPSLCSAIGRADLSNDPRFKTGWLRSQNYVSLEPILTEAIKLKSTREWLKELEEFDIPCAPVNNHEQVASDPHVAARHMIVSAHYPQAGDFKVVNAPFKFSRTPCNPKRDVPALGEHTEKILEGLLEMSKQDIDELKKTGIV